MRLLFIINELDNEREQNPLVQKKVVGCILNPYTCYDGYLIYLKLPQGSMVGQGGGGGSCDEKFEWTGRSVDLYASLSISSTLFERNVNKNAAPCASLILLTASQSVLDKKRAELEQNLGEQMIALDREKTGFHPNIDIEAVIDNLKDYVLKLRTDTTQFLNHIELDLVRELARAHIGYEDEVQHLKTIKQNNFNQICRTAYEFGVRLHLQCIKFMTYDRAEEFSAGLAEFASVWYQKIAAYIRNKNEKRKKNSIF